MTLHLVGDLSAPALARDFVTAQLAMVREINRSSSPTDVVLVVSELVTNSVQAGAQSVVVSLHVGADRIDLEVADDAAGWPTPRQAQPDEVNGRGLALALALTDSCTVDRRHPGKSVTATWLRQP